MAILKPKLDPLKASSEVKAVRVRMMQLAVARTMVVAMLMGVGLLAVAQPPSAFLDKSSQPASQASPADLSNVGIDQRLDQQLPLDLQFKDETGKTVKLGDYFQSGRPVILNLVYYTCPMLCGEELAGEASALGVLRFTPGKEYEVVSVSFNPDETPKDAADKKQVYIARMNEHLEHKTDGSGWHFLTGQQAEIKQLADAVGFHYRRDAADRAVHSCHGHHDRDAERQDCSVLLRG